MKRFFGFFSITLIMMSVIVLSMFAFGVLADTGTIDENVIYIKNNPSVGGTGKTATDPLYPIQYPARDLESNGITQNNYKNTALYQAVEKLSDTGGTVVICGDYTLTNDNARGRDDNFEYCLPITKKAVRITSYYRDKNNKVEDYRNNAKLILQGNFHIILNGPTVWENLNINTSLSADRAICCNGNKTVFGEGLTCTTENNRYLSIAGGKRYEGFTSDVDVTVKSGTFYKLIGTTWTNPDPNNSGVEIDCIGDVNLQIEGGQITYVYGNSHNTVPNSFHWGDVNISITGGKISGGYIACTGNGGFKTESCKVNVKISGSTFDSGIVIKSRETWDGEEITGFASNNINIDLTDAVGVPDGRLNTIVTNLPEGAKVKYPTDWITGVIMTNAPSADTFVFCGDKATAEGAVLNVTYQNPISGNYIYQTVEYSKNNSAFRAVYDESKNGNVDIDYYFGDKKYHTGKIDVIAVPDVDIDGVRIRTDTKEQQMYGWGNYTSGDYSQIEVKECGVIAIPSDMLVTGEPFDHTNTYKMYDAVADKNIYSGSKISFGALVFGDEAIRENNYNRDYSLRAYVKISYNGKDYYRYSDIIQRSFYDVAKMAIEGDKETAETKTALNTNLISVYDNYDETTKYNSEGATAARQKVVSYMESMMNIEWTPNKTFILYNNPNHAKGAAYSIGPGSTEMYAIFIAGKTYRGIPYVNNTLAQLENFKDRIAEKENSIIKNNLVHTWSISSDYIFTLWLSDAEELDGVENARNFPGNDCYYSVLFAWNTVLNNRAQISLMNSLENSLGGKNGVIAVGNYDNSNYYDNSTYGISTKQTVQANGEQTMANAYAKLQPGDATVYAYTDSNGNIQRHVRMIHKAPTVKYTTAGKIDLANSEVECIDQAGGGDTRYIWNNSISSIQVKTRTFKEMYTEGSLPITIPELATGNSDAQFTYAAKMNLEEDLPQGKISGVIKSNRQIISVKAVISQNGSVVKEVKETLSTQGSMVHIDLYNLRTLDLSGLNLTPGGNYEFDLYACVSGMNGAEVQLVDSYEFTAA